VPRNEYELIEHGDLADVKLFLVDLAYRNLHMHNDFELCLLLRGELEVNVQRTTYLFSQNDLILFNPKQPHELRTQANSRALILSLQFSPRFCARYYPQIRNIEFSAIDLCRQTSQAAVLNIRQQLLDLAHLYFKDGDHYELLAYAGLNNLLHSLISQLTWRLLSEGEKAQKATLSDRLNRILDDIEHHYTGKILLSDIATRENLSMTYLSHLFKDNLGLTFQDYVNQRRFDEARSLVERTTMNLTDICLASGFSDSRYLTKAFQQQLGCTPTEYRNRISRQRPEVSIPSNHAVQRILSREESIDQVMSFTSVPTPRPRSS